MKILFSDLDGTLLNDNKIIDSKNIEAIHRMIQAGNHFVITTGRPLAAVLPIAEQYGFFKQGFYLVTFNGGLIFDCGKKNALIKRTISPELVKIILDKAHEQGLHAHACGGEILASEYETEELKEYARSMKMQYEIVNDVRQFPIPPIKVNVISSRGHALLETFRTEILPHTQGVLFDVFSRRDMLEFLDLKSHKGEAISFVAKLLQIPLSQTIACGDEENDLTMIQNAGLGIAMKNANSILKEQAQYTTKNSNNENGIAEIIEKFIL